MLSVLYCVAPQMTVCPSLDIAVILQRCAVTENELSRRLAAFGEVRSTKREVCVGLRYDSQSAAVLLIH